MKKIIILLVLSLLVMTLFSACKSTSVDTTPEKAAENFVVALFTANSEKLLDSVPEFWIRAMAEAAGVSAENRAELIKIMSSEIDQDDISECIIFSSVIDAKSPYLDQYMEALEEHYYYTTDEDLSKIEECCIVNVDSKVDGDERGDIVFCVKYDGIWYALDIY